MEGAHTTVRDFDVSKPTAKANNPGPLKMRNLLSRAVFDKTFKAGEKFGEPNIVMVPATYLPRRRLQFHGAGKLETLTLGEDIVGDDQHLLVDDVLVQIQKHNGNPIGLQFPLTWS